MTVLAVFLWMAVLSIIICVSFVIKLYTVQKVRTCVSYFCNIFTLICVLVFFLHFLFFSQKLHTKLKFFIIFCVWSISILIIWNIYWLLLLLLLLSLLLLLLLSLLLLLLLMLLLLWILLLFLLYFFFNLCGSFFFAFFQQLHTKLKFFIIFVYEELLFW